MTTDWRGKELDVGDLVIFTRGTSNRAFAVGKILDFIPNYYGENHWHGQQYIEIGLMVEIVEESGFKNLTKRPSKILLRNATKIE